MKKFNQTQGPKSRRRHNMTLGDPFNIPNNSNFLVDVCNSSYVEKPTKIKILDIIQNHNSLEKGINPIQNYIQSCRNMNSKHVSFKQLPSRNSLFSNLRKQVTNKKNISEGCLEFKVLPFRVNTPKSNDYMNSDYKMNRFTLPKTFFNESQQNMKYDIIQHQEQRLSKQEQIEIQQQIQKIKQKAMGKLIKKYQQQLANQDIQLFLKSIKQEVQSQFDIAIKNIFSKRKKIYELAQQEVQSYFSRKKEKSNKSINTQMTRNTTQGTPCFQQTQNRNNNSNQVKQFKLFESGNPHSNNNKQRLKSLPMEEKEIGAFEAINSKNLKKQIQTVPEENSRSVRAKNRKTTKSIKNKIIFGGDGSEKNEIQINQFNIC